MRPVAATYRFMNGPLRAPPCGTLTLGARLPAPRPRRGARKRPRGHARDVREQVRGGGRDETGLSDVQVHERPAELASAPSDTRLRAEAIDHRVQTALGAMRRAPALVDESAGRFERPRAAHMRDRARRACSASLERAPARVRAHRSPGARAWLQIRRMDHRLRVYSPLDRRAEALWPRGEREGVPATADPENVS